VQRWTAEQVNALAPDAAGLAAGRKLASPQYWTHTGTSNDPLAVWGYCQGSGAHPYQVVVDISGPAYKCSCPSRKFPCKHTLGILLLWAANQIGDADAPAWVTEWTNDRATKAAKQAEPPKAPTADPATAARREAQRSSRVTSGLDELDRWLRDQARTGIAGTDRAGYRHFNAVAARMVDAQAAGVASTLRSLASVAVSGDGWPARLLEEYALLRLLATAHRNREALPPDLAAVVRRRVGYAESRDEVLASAPVRDHWSVLALRDSADDRLTMRRVWLQGRDTRRMAVVLSYAVSGQALDASLVPGTTLDADVHFYPGSSPLRALVGAQHVALTPRTSMVGGTIQDALTAHAAALAGDPWLSEWPVVIDAVVPALVHDNWLISDGDDALLCDRNSADMWRALAVSGGHPVTLLAELTATHLRPLAIVATDPNAAPTLVAL
jgi:SWIM zinc finger